MSRLPGILSCKIFTRGNTFSRIKLQLKKEEEKEEEAIVKLLCSSFGRTLRKTFSSLIHVDDNKHVHRVCLGTKKKKVGECCQIWWPWFCLIWKEYRSIKPKRTTSLLSGALPLSDVESVMVWVSLLRLGIFQFSLKLFGSLDVGNFPSSLCKQVFLSVCPSNVGMVGHFPAALCY